MPTRSATACRPVSTRRLRRRCVVPCAGRLWEFLQLPPDARQEKISGVLQDLEDEARSRWAGWLCEAKDEEKAALFDQALARTIVGRLVERDRRIPGANMSWGDAESLGFIAITGVLLLVLAIESCFPLFGAIFVDS